MERGSDELQEEMEAKGNSTSLVQQHSPNHTVNVSLVLLSPTMEKNYMFKFTDDRSEPYSGRGDSEQPSSED